MPELKPRPANQWQPGNPGGPGRPRKRRVVLPGVDGVDFGGAAVLQRLDGLAGVPQLTDAELAEAVRAASIGVDTFAGALAIVLSEWSCLRLELNRRDVRSTNVVLMAKRLGRMLSWTINGAVSRGIGHSVRAIDVSKIQGDSLASVLQLPLGIDALDLLLSERETEDDEAYQRELEEAAKELEPTAQESAHG